MTITDSIDISIYADSDLQDFYNFFKYVISTSLCPEGKCIVV